MQEDLTYQSVAPRLLNAVPELTAVYDEHVAYYDEVLPYLLIADVARAVLSWCRELAATPTRQCELRDRVSRLMRYVESAIHSRDVMLRDLMTAGFIDALDPVDPGFSVLLSVMEPSTRQWAAATFQDVRRHTGH